MYRNKISFISLFAFLLCASCIAVPGEYSRDNLLDSVNSGLDLVLYVSSEDGNDSNIGTNAAFPLSSLEKAISIAASAGSAEIRVSGDFSKSGSESWLFENLTNLILTGGYSSDFSSVGTATLLDGSAVPTNVLAFFDCSNVTVSNFSVTGGVGKNGGGIFSASSVDIFLHGLSVYNNSSVSYGGGITFNYVTNAVLKDVSLYSNSSKNGGGFNGYKSSGLTFNGLSAYGNSSTVYGGGALSFNYADGVVISNSVLTNNTANCEGGGIMFSQYDDGIFIYDTVIRYNHCDLTNLGYEGGGVYYANSATNITTNSGCVFTPNFRGSGVTNTNDFVQAI